MKSTLGQANGGQINSLHVVDVLSIFLPDVRHVRGVGHRLAPQQCILGHIDGGALWMADNDRRTYRSTDDKTKQNKKWHVKNVQEVQLEVQVFAKPLVSVFWSICSTFNTIK